MRTIFLSAFLSLNLLATAAPKKPAKAVPAVPAISSQLDDDAAKPSARLINSDLGGRELSFVAQAIDLGKALRYLATQTPRTSNSALRGFGDDLVKTLAAQSAVLNTIAEMRHISVPAAKSDTEKRIAARISPLEGARLEKAILDAFMDIDLQVIAAYKIGATSQDQTIRKFVEQTLPQVREHLVLVEAIAGISPDRPAAAMTETTAPIVGDSPASAPAIPARPAFRMKVGLHGEPGAPAAE